MLNSFVPINLYKLSIPENLEGNTLDIQEN